MIILNELIRKRFFGENADDVFHDIICPAFQGWKIAGANRMGHHGKMVALESMGERHVLGRTDEGFGADYRRWGSLLFDSDPVEQTARAAGASVSDPG